MKRLIVMALLLLLLDPNMAAARPEEVGDADRIIMTDAHSETNATVTTGGSNASVSRKPGSTGVRREVRLPPPAIIFVAGTGACMSNGNSSLITEPLLDVAFSLPGCPGSTGRAAGSPSPPPPTPLEAAYHVWYWETELPSPTLSTSPPNGAITGLDLYLSIGGAQTMT